MFSFLNSILSLQIENINTPALLILHFVSCFSISNFTNGIYSPLSLFLLATKLAWGIRVCARARVNDEDNEGRQRKSSQRAVGREVGEGRKNESKVKEKVKEKKTRLCDGERKVN